MCEPLKVAKCERSGKLKAQRKELIKRVTNMSEDENNEHGSDEGSLDRIIERKIDRKKKEEKKKWFLKWLFRLVLSEFVISCFPMDLSIHSEHESVSVWVKTG